MLPGFHLELGRVGVCGAGSLEAESRAYRRGKRGNARVRDPRFRSFPSSPRGGLQQREGRPAVAARHFERAASNLGGIEAKLAR
jgi:hypothetical protein